MGYRLKPLLLIVTVMLALLASDRLLAAPRESHKIIPVKLVNSTPTTVRGAIKGYDTVDYKVSAGAGQTLTVTMTASNGANYFNINPPDSGNVAMFIGSDVGNAFTGMIPADGGYVVRVYLMRSAARRKEHSNFSLTLKVDGEPLHPIPHALDALIPGTKYHAQTTIKCTTVWAATTECPAFVVRYNFNGSATVDVRVTDSVRRRILFVNGTPKAADSTFPLSFSKDADFYDIRFDRNERYSFPESLIFGG